MTVLELVTASTSGTAVAILTSGAHIVTSGRWDSFQSFKSTVREYLKAHRYDVVKFWYGWGDGECQQYTPAEVLEVYFGE